MAGWWETSWTSERSACENKPTCRMSSVITSLRSSSSRPRYTSTSPPLQRQPRRQHRHTHHPSAAPFPRPHPWPPRVRPVATVNVEIRRYWGQEGTARKPVRAVGTVGAQMMVRDRGEEVVGFQGGSGEASASAPGNGRG
ncbi:unnamed protein product [Sphacelaria rigidula]